MTTAGPPVKGRATRQRAAVAAALDEVDEFRSAQELHDMLKHKGDSVGLTTVYRTLQSLADAGEVDVLRTSDGETVDREPNRYDVRLALEPPGARLMNITPPAIPP